MLDPNVQKKGGFGAFAERDQARHAARVAEGAPEGGARDDAATESPAAPDATAPDATAPVVPTAHVAPARGRAFTPRG